MTSNQGKYQEISSELEKAGISVEWKRMEYDEMQGKDTYSISLRSCMDVGKKLEGDFFLEDTGLYCEALNGFPGPYAKYVQETVGNAGLIRMLQGMNRKAKFVTVISLRHGDRIVQFDGVLSGIISESERGSNGFGFDPIYIPDGEDRTLAEMSPYEKNHISHRGKAIRKLARYVEENKLN
ncbi:MAG: RdgB/HAM1 family non-canonical purine NTP pyrophosphatase [Candidatus Thermoplasmatota archaeon]|nr:RdgB/HAM1 family non-canonical purine NTP pyrophosphatase [Candidatus Thermoplasmatota archaeon]MCL5438158.1 RdgB/HAM1 family non-canonical purine NTP pyrophosphatase [Candidatus Thermoplasmatota archaeon]